MTRRQAWQVLLAGTALVVAGPVAPAMAKSAARRSPADGDCRGGIPPMDVDVESLGVAVREVKMNASSVGYVDGRPVLYVQGGTPTNPVQFAMLDAVTGTRLRHYEIAELGDSLSMITAPDGKVYIPGWGPDALLFRYDPTTDTMANLGEAVAGESHIARLVAAEDGTLYGGTYPNGHVFSYDPATERFTDYGRLDGNERYARSVAYDEAGHLYAGTEGTGRLIRVDLATGERVEIPQPATMNPDDYRISLMAWRDGLLFAYYGGSLEWHVYDPAARQWVAHLPRSAPSMPTEISADGKVYFANDTDKRLFAFDIGTREYAPVGWDQPLDYTLGGGGINLIELGHPDFPGESVIGMGRNGGVWRYHPATGHGDVLTDAELPTTPVTIRCFGSGRDGEVYVGLTFSQGHLVTYHPETGEMTDADAPTLTRQVHQILTTDDAVYLGTYTGAAFQRYDPSRPVGETNPRVVFDLSEHHQDRMFGLAEAGDRIAIGTLGMRGQESGRLLFYTPATGEVTDFGEILYGHQLIAMGVVGNTLYIGTSINTPGADPVAEEARIVAWDLTTDTVTWQAAPVPGLMTISALVPREDGHLWALTTEGTVFRFNPEKRQVEHTVQVTGPGGVDGYPKLAAGKDGLCYGSTGTGKVFALHPGSGDHKVLTDGKYLLPHTDGRLYCARGSEMFRATLTRTGKAGVTPCVPSSPS